MIMGASALLLRCQTLHISQKFCVCFWKASYHFVIGCHTVGSLLNCSCFYFVSWACKTIQCRGFKSCTLVSKCTAFFGNTYCLSNFCELAPVCHRAIFHAHFLARFLNLVTFTLVHSFHFSLVIIAFHLVFVLSLCYPIHDSHKLLWLDDYTPLFYSSFTLFHSMKWGPDRFLWDFWWLYTN